MFRCSSETGICEWVDYDTYRESLEEKEDEIRKLKYTIEDLETELWEHKQLIEELKKSYEEVMCEKRNRSYLN